MSDLFKTFVAVLLIFTWLHTITIKVYVKDIHKQLAELKANQIISK